MSYYAGIDVSLEVSHVCVIDGNGKIVREGMVASEPEALIAWLGSVALELTRIGLEAGPLSQWLYAAMRDAGLAVELLETRHVRNAFKIMPVKTDRKDAQGIAELMRLGWFRPVHCKSMEAQETRAMLTARKLVQKALHEVEMSLRGVLRGFGLKIGKVAPTQFEARIRKLVEGHPSLEVIATAMLSDELPGGRIVPNRRTRPAAIRPLSRGACAPTSRRPRQINPKRVAQRVASHRSSGSDRRRTLVPRKNAPPRA
jgi:transposase